jgi:hypothetical protein
VSRTCEFLTALFLLGALLFAPPLLIIFNEPIRILGIPLLYFYLFAVWTGLIVLVALVVERRDVEPDEDEAGSEMPARDHRQGTGGVG